MATSLVILLLHCALVLVASACVSAKLVEHTFQVQNLTVERLCREQEIITINGKYPGPTIYAHEGDTVIVHVLNDSPYAISIHWHGIRMLLNGWADGAGYVTQCPILPGSNYTYQFNITQQEGTLWWHAHVSWLRATIHGAIIIYPPVGHSYPFKKPYKEVPILLGEWWNQTNIVGIGYVFENQDQRVFISDAYTINGQPGDFYECSSDSIYTLKVKHGKTYLLRIINAGLNNVVNFKIANHRMVVVSADASYTNPYVTDLVVIAPGQTVDVLLEADQPPASYYMVSRGYVTYNGSVLYENENNATSGILIYDCTPSPSNVEPILSTLPDIYDTSTIYDFYASLTGLTTAPYWSQVPQTVDEHLFINIGLGYVPYYSHRAPGSHPPPTNILVYGNMNNVSFVLPDKVSMLEAFFFGVDGIYTTDFPDEPQIKFDYTSINNQFNEDLLWIGEEATKVRKFRYNTTVQIVLQNTALVSTEVHPIHLHGYDFYILAQGFGNYNPVEDPKEFNLVNPQRRNSVAVPAGGWVAIRFRTDNPGIWLIHCHLEFHMSLGVATAFLVENGPTPSTSLSPPPSDLPKCENSGMFSAK